MLTMNNLGKQPAEQQQEQQHAINYAAQIESTTTVNPSLYTDFNGFSKNSLSQTTEETTKTAGTTTVASFENLLRIATQKTFRFLRKRNANSYYNSEEQLEGFGGHSSSNNYSIMTTTKKPINAAITNMTNPAKESASATTTTAYLETDVDDDFLNSNNLSATITSIRSNVTRVLYMYFQNVSDEHGYGAATTTTTSTTTMLPTILQASSMHNKPTMHHHHGHHSQHNNGLEQHQHQNYLLQMTSNSSSSNHHSTPTLATATNFVQNLSTATASKAAVITSEYFQNSTYNSNSAASNNRTSELTSSNNNNINYYYNSSSNNNNVLQTTLGHLNDMAKATASAVATAAGATSATATAATTTTKAPSITYPRYRIAIKSYENCSALFANYTQPQEQGELTKKPKLTLKKFVFIF